MTDETTTADPTPPTPPEAVAAHAADLADQPAADTTPPAAETPSAEPESTAGPDEAAAAESEPAPEAPEVAAERPASENETGAVEEPTEVDEPEAEPAPAADAAEEPEPAPAPAGDEPAAEAEPDEAAAAETAPAEPAEDTKKKWYVIKVQSGREESIKAAIERKVKIEGLEEFFGEILIPYEEFVEKKSVRAKVKNKKTGEVETVTQEKNVVKKRKKFHGYIFANVEFNDRILYLFRETSGVGDFVGGGGPMKPPAPMAEIEVRKMLGTARPEDKKPVTVKLDYEKGDRVRVKDGAFAGSEAEVKAIALPKDPTDTPKVTVVVTIWGRPVEMEMDYWHVEKL